jgi:RNA polymerase sigma-70 factor (ECF subfamily)
MTKVGWYTIGTSTPLESNKSLPDMAKQNARQPWDEKALAALHAGQLESGFTALVHGYAQLVLAYCIATMGEEALGQEVAVEVFAALWRALAGFKQESSFQTWILAIARHLCWKRRGTIGRLRRWFVSGIDTTLIDTPPDAADSPEEDRSKQQQAERLRRALEQLTRKDRDLISMHYFEALSLEAMAKRRSQGTEAVRQALFKAQYTLKQIIAWSYDAT